MIYLDTAQGYGYISHIIKHVENSITAGSSFSFFSFLLLAFLMFILRAEERRPVIVFLNSFLDETFALLANEILYDQFSKNEYHITYLIQRVVEEQIRRINKMFVEDDEATKPNNKQDPVDKVTFY